MKKRLILFLIVCLVLFIITFLIKRILLTEDLVYNLYSEQLTQEIIDQILKSQQKWEWVGYLVIPLVVLLRSSLVAICLSVGMFFYNMEHTIKFKHFFKIALVGEFVLVLVGFFKLGYFYFIKTDYTLKKSINEKNI